MSLLINYDSGLYSQIGRTSLTDTLSGCDAYKQHNWVNYSDINHNLNWLFAAHRSFVTVKNNL